MKFDTIVSVVDGTIVACRLLSFLTKSLNIEFNNW